MLKKTGASTPKLRSAAGAFQKSMTTPDRWPLRHGTEQKLAKKKP